MAVFTEVENPVLKNKLELTIYEVHTNVNEHDTAVGPITFNPEGVESKEDVEIFMRCLDILIKKIDHSRKADRGNGIPYNYVDFDEFEDEFDEIKVDNCDEVIIFTKNGKEYIYPYEYDLGMPTEDARYFAGVNFSCAFFYDENGNKFKVEM